MILKSIIEILLLVIFVPLVAAIWMRFETPKEKSVIEAHDEDIERFQNALHNLGNAIIDEFRQKK